MAAAPSEQSKCDNNETSIEEAQLKELEAITESLDQLRVFSSQFGEVGNAIRQIREAKVEMNHKDMKELLKKVNLFDELEGLFQRVEEIGLKLEHYLTQIGLIKTRMLECLDKMAPKSKELFDITVAQRQLVKLERLFKHEREKFSNRLVVAWRNLSQDLETANSKYSEVQEIVGTHKASEERWKKIRNALLVGVAVVAVVALVCYTGGVGALALGPCLVPAHHLCGGVSGTLFGGATVAGVAAYHYKDKIKGAFAVFSHTLEGATEFAKTVCEQVGKYHTLLSKGEQECKLFFQDSLYDEYLETIEHIRENIKEQQRHLYEAQEQLANGWKTSEKKP